MITSPSPLLRVKNGFQQSRGPEANLMQLVVPLAAQSFAQLVGQLMNRAVVLLMPNLLAPLVVPLVVMLVALLVAQLVSWSTAAEGSLPASI